MILINKRKRSKSVSVAACLGCDVYFDSGGVTSSEVGIINFTKLISSTIVSWLAVNKT
jgi:hypothetical protein